MLITSLRARSVLRALACWRRHAPAVQLALAVTVGQGLMWFLSEFWLYCSLALMGVILLIRRWRGHAWLVAGALVGVASAILSPIYNVPRGELRGELTVAGTVQGTPRHPRPGEVTFEVRTDESLQSQLIRCRAIDLPWRNAAHLNPGDTVWVRGVFTPVTKPLNPFSWDAWLWRRGVSAECKARFVSVPIIRATPQIYKLREAVLTRVMGTLGDSHGAGLFLSMSLGYHDLLSVPLEKAFTRLGLTHLLVVSGYQVSLAFSFILWCITAVAGWARYGSRYVRVAATLVAFFSAMVYVVFIGAEMSAVRALMAAACICATLLSDRETSFAQRWGVALLGMQLLWPWCGYDIGVVLTFAALFGIGLGSDVAPRRKLTLFATVTAAVWLCTSLVVVVWQGTISPLGLVLNLLIAAPWSIINCTAGLMALGLLFTGLPGAEHPLRILVSINQVLSELVLHMGEVSYGSWQLEGIPRIVASLLLTFGVGSLVYRSISIRRVRLL